MSYSTQIDHIRKMLILIDQMAINRNDRETMLCVTAARIALNEADMFVSRLKDSNRMLREELEDIKS
jgi:hypothetical protein